MNTYRKAVKFLRDAGRKAAAAPYWGMALLATADNARPPMVEIKPLANQTRFTWTNPAAPKRGPVLSLQALFPQILAGTIDGAIKHGIHFAHAARVAGVAGAAKAETGAAWRTICERYDVGFEDIRHVAGPLAEWYRSDSTDKTPTAFAAVIEAALTDTDTDDTDGDTDGETETETETETDAHPFVSMVETAGYPKRRDRLEAWLVAALETDAVANGGTGLVARTVLLGASICQRQTDARDAAIAADGADAATLAATGTDG